jgi:outer membrane protein TolC
MCVVVLAAASAADAQAVLTLESTMTRAKEATPESRALASAIDEAQARVRRAQSGFWPHLVITETVQRGNHPVFVFSSLLSQRRFGAADFAIPSLNTPAPITNTRTALLVEHAVFDAGASRLAVRTAALGRETTRAVRDAALQDLAFGAAQTFVRVLELEVRLRATDAAVAAAESDRHRALGRRDVGLVTDADVLAVDVHLADMRERQISVAADLAIARLQLAEAVGLPLTESIALVPPSSAPVPPDSDALVRDAITMHPRHRQAAIDVDRADTARRLARAALSPTVGLQAGWELNGASLDAQRTSWVVGAELRMHLFRGFSDTAQVAEARHAHARATAERERVDRRIEVDVRGALARLSAARARADAGRAAVAQAREAQRITRDRYESGLATVTDVLRAAEATLDAESRANAAELDVILQTLAVDRAAGRL